MKSTDNAIGIYTDEQRRIKVLEDQVDQLATLQREMARQMVEQSRQLKEMRAASAAMTFVEGALPKPQLILPGNQIFRDCTIVVPHIEPDDDGR